MELKITEEQLNQIISKESTKLVGTIMKRYEIIPDKDTLKAEIKELIYESLRNIRDIILQCAKSNCEVYLTVSDKKSEEKNGPDKK